MDLDSFIDLSLYAPQKLSIDMLPYEMSKRLGAFVYGIEPRPIALPNHQNHQNIQNPQNPPNAQTSQNPSQQTQNPFQNPPHNPTDSTNATNPTNKALQIHQTNPADSSLVEHIIVVMQDFDDETSEENPQKSKQQESTQKSQTQALAKQTISHHLSAYHKPILFVRESSHYFSWILQGLSFLEKYYGLRDISAQLDFVLQEAIAHRASDVHLEDKGDFGSIRFRIDGRLREIARLTKDSTAKLSSKIKLESKLDITETRMPQDGRYARNFGEMEYDFRISCVPLLSGESLVLRILYKHKEQISLENLGLSRDIVEILAKALNRKNGLILITGPTGSGKSTTLYAALDSLKTSQKKLITLEDPIEYQIPLATQIQINPEIGFSFFEALSFVLRQDPDIIMIGEIRDKQTLELALNASLTGHLVLASLHSNDCISTLERLFEMGAPRSVVESSLICIIAQRLLGRLCPHCKAQMPQSQKEAGDEARFYAVGCEKCQGLGIKGREVIAQGIYFDKELKEAFYEMPLFAGSSANKNDNAKSNQRLDSSDWRGNLKMALLAKNLPTLKDDALRKKQWLDYKEITQLD
ncbi:ATPase, T2SS/T4P/T4SS family [Helicobacter sp. T3_23-1059]